MRLQDTSADSPAIPIEAFCTTTVAACVKNFGANVEKGLSKAKVRVNRAAWGTNQLPVLEVEPIHKIVLGQFGETVTMVSNTHACG